MCVCICMYMYVYISCYVCISCCQVLAVLWQNLAQTVSQCISSQCLLCNQSVLPRYSVTNMLQTGLIFPLHPPLFSYNNPTKCHNAYPGSYAFLNM